VTWQCRKTEEELRGMKVRLLCLEWGKRGAALEFFTSSHHMEPTPVSE
jgi:hypothetical protein